MTKIDKIFQVYRNQNGKLIINVQNMRTNQSRAYKGTPATVSRIKRIAFDSYKTKTETPEYWVNRKRLNGVTQ